jgi:hypothetical protein
VRPTTDVARATRGARVAATVANAVFRRVVRATRTVLRVHPWATGRRAVRVLTVPGPMVVSTIVGRGRVPVRALGLVRVRKALVPMQMLAVLAVVRVAVVPAAEGPTVATAVGAGTSLP